VIYWRKLLICMAAMLLATACDNHTVQSLLGRASTDVPIDHKTMDWTDLMPSSDLEALLNPPDYVSEVDEGSLGDEPVSMLKSTITVPNDRYQQALISTRVRPELDGNDIRIAGYLVPVEYNDNQEATTFFAVPFFGACLHLPPPPPNQIILVQSEKGVRIDDMYTPYWLSGELHTDLQENDMAESAYTMTLQSAELYSEP
jgi:hypothetical protein